MLLESLCLSVSDKLGTELLYTIIMVEVVLSLDRAENC